MRYEEDKVIQAFNIYKELALVGRVGKDELTLYKADDEIRSLVDLFAKQIDCVMMMSGPQLLMIPATKLSPFHVNNDYLKRHHLKSGATNADIHLLYFSVIVLFGSFYDSYQTKEPTRDFIELEEWVREIDERINTLKEHAEEKLKIEEKEFSYNWMQIIQKWDDMNDLKESAKKQSGNTISRLSFIDASNVF